MISYIYINIALYLCNDSQKLESKKWRFEPNDPSGALWASKLGAEWEILGADMCGHEERMAGSAVAIEAKTERSLACRPDHLTYLVSSSTGNVFTAPGTNDYIYLKYCVLYVLVVLWTHYWPALDVQLHGVSSTAGEQIDYYEAAKSPASCYADARADGWIIDVGISCGRIEHDEN